MTTTYDRIAIRSLRHRVHGWTLRKLADKVGVTPKTIYQWESGRSTPDARMIAALADAFGVGVGAFFKT